MRRIVLLLAVAFVVVTVFAAPASAGIAKKCDNKRQGPGFDREDRCCVNKADSPQERKKCTERTNN